MPRTDRLRPGLLVALLGLGMACSRPVAPLPDVPAASPTPAPRMELPRDAGPHDDLTEWWYYTGHLRSEPDGRAYGFEFTVFQSQRQGAPTGYLAHFAVSDIEGQRFSHQAHHSQGLQSFPIDVDGWLLGTDGGSDVIQAAMLGGPGADPPFSLQIRLTDEKPAALHHSGYIDYGLAGGSYYYSRTRLSVTGELRQAGADALRVSGVAWMDHQWGNFVVSAAGGWDWYSLQLDDRTEVMLYVLRGLNGETTRVYGTQVQPDGSVRELQAGDVRAESTGSWTSPHTGGVYPSGWRLSLPGGVRLDIRPSLLDQELFFPVDGGQWSAASTRAYWEGAVSVDGDRSGVGYVELTGYAGR